MKFGLVKLEDAEAAILTLWLLLAGGGAKLQFRLPRTWRP